MKTVRMALLTALMALSFGAFAAPAMAADAVWTNEGIPLEKPAEVELDGVLKFGSFQAQLASCHMNAEATLEPGGQGEITTVNLSSCSHPSTECKQGTTSVTVPWSITPEWVGGSGRVSIDDTALKIAMASPCNFNLIWATDGHLGAAPADYSEITELNLSGSFSGPELNAGWVADLAVSFPESEPWAYLGIEEAY